MKRSQRLKHWKAVRKAQKAARAKSRTYAGFVRGLMKEIAVQMSVPAHLLQFPTNYWQGQMNKAIARTEARRVIRTGTLMHSIKAQPADVVAERWPTLADTLKRVEAELGFNPLRPQTGGYRPPSQR